MKEGRERERKIERERDKERAREKDRESQREGEKERAEIDEPTIKDRISLHTVKYR